MTQTTVIPFPLERLLKAIQCVHVRLQKPTGEIIVDMRVFGTEFAPKIFDRTNVTLTVTKDDGTATQIAGTLEAKPSEHPRGTHYAFIFTPMQKEMRGLVTFRGLNDFSNVRSMTFSVRNETHCIRNVFHLAPGETR